MAPTIDIGKTQVEQLLSPQNKHSVTPREAVSKIELLFLRTK